jgi:hypothetical protein
VAGRCGRRPRMPWQQPWALRGADAALQRALMGVEPEGGLGCRVVARAPGRRRRPRHQRGGGGQRRVTRGPRGHAAGTATGCAPAAPSARLYLPYPRRPASGTAGRVPARRAVRPPYLAGYIRALTCSGTSQVHARYKRTTGGTPSLLQQPVQGFGGDVICAQPYCKHSAHSRVVIGSAVSGWGYGEQAAAGGRQGLPSMRSCRTSMALRPCLRAVSM